MTIPLQSKTDGIIGKTDIEAGKYAVCQFEMSKQDFPRAWDWINGQWFPSTNCVPDDKPYFELCSEQPKGEVFNLDICIPIKS